MSKASLSHVAQHIVGSDDVAALQVEVAMAREKRDAARATYDAEWAELVRLRAFVVEKDKYGNDVVERAVNDSLGQLNLRATETVIPKLKQVGDASDIHYANQQAKVAWTEYTQADNEYDRLRDQLTTAQMRAVDLDAVQAELNQLVAEDQSLFETLYSLANDLRVHIQRWNRHVKRKSQLRAFLVEQTRRDVDGGMRGGVTRQWAEWIFNEFVNSVRLRRQFALMANGQGLHNSAPTWVHTLKVVPPLQHSANPRVQSQHDLD